MDVELTEFSDLIDRYTADFVGRDWLATRTAAHLADPACRFVVLTGDPGVGKTAFMAHLAAAHPGWLRYFIRRNSRELLSPGDAKTFLLTIGGQFATLHPELFHPEHLEIVIHQRIGEVTPEGRAVGAVVEELDASPFYRVAIEVEQRIRRLAGSATGLRIGRLVTEPRLLSMQDLQYLGLLDPARLLLRRQPAARVVVLVDALDELRYSPADSDVLRVLRQLPATTPSNLKFVVSSRPDVDLGRFLDRPDVRHLRLIPSETENRADLRRYANGLLAGRALAPAFAAAGIDRSAFAPALLAKAAGNFLYLRSVLDGIQEAQRDPGRRELLGRLLRVEELPDNLDALYAYFLAAIVEWTKDQFGKGAWRRYLRPLLGVLAVAAEPVTDEQLVDFAGLELADIRDLLRELRQFIGPDAAAPGSYRIFHSSFAEFLTDSDRNHDYWVDPAAAHKRFVKHFRVRGAEDWPRILSDSYARKHLAVHLAGAGDHQALYGLISLPWMEAKLSATGSTWAFLQDATDAMQAAGDEQPPNLPQLIRAALITTTLRILASAVPPPVLQVLAQAGKADRAAEYAALIQDARQQSESYQRICDALTARGSLDQAASLAERIGQPWRQALAWSRIRDRAGERAAADRALDEAIAVAAGGRLRTREEVLGEAGRVLAESGDVVRLTRRLDGGKGDDPVASTLLRAFVDGLVRRADGAGLRRLLELIPTLPGDELKATALVAVAPHLRLIGDMAAMPRAVEAAEGIAEEDRRAGALGALARGATVEDDRAALERIAAAAERIGATWTRVLLIDDVCRATVRLGDRDRVPWIAGQLADAIAATPEDGSWKRAEVLSRAAELLALVGEHEQAHDVVEEALLAAHRTRFERDPAVLTMFAGLMARAGRVDRATELARYGLTAAHRALLLAQIAVALADGGPGSRAMELAEQAASTGSAFDDPGERAHVLLAAAQAMTALDDTLRALGLLDKVRAAADRIDHRAQRVRLLARLAVAWAAAGQPRRAADTLAEAVAAADSLGDADRVGLLGDLLGAASEIGAERPPTLDPARVSQLAETVGPADRVAQGVAVALARAGATAEALALADTLSNEEHKADALGTVLLVGQGQDPPAAQTAITRVRATAGRLREPRYRSVLLDHVIEALANARAYDEAVALAQEIELPMVVPQSLAVVASVAAANGDHRQADSAAALARDALIPVADPAARTRTLDHLARASTAVGDRRRAEALAQEALQAMLQIDRSDESLTWLPRVAETLIGLGMGEAAAEAAERILDKGTFNPRIGAMLAPVARAWALLGELTRAAELLDAIEASRAPAPELFEPLTRAMRLDEALGLAERLGFDGLGRPALDAVAQALLSPGPGVNVAATADRILKIAGRARSSRVDPELLAVVGHALALAGASRAVRIADRALARLDKAELGLAGERALDHVLGSYARLGVLSSRAEQLARMVERFDQVDDRTTAATAIAQMVLASGDADTALRVITPVLTPPVIDDDLEAYAQAQALSALSVAASHAGRTRLALELARQARTAAAAIEHYQGQVGASADKDGALADAARAFAVAGDHDTALDQARVILRPLHRMGILVEVARAAAPTGATDAISVAAAQASRLAEVKQVSDRAFLRCGAALALAAAGDASGAARQVDRVLALERRLENPANRALVWSLAAEALAGTQEADRAVEIAERGIAFATEHTHPDERLWALLGCAQGLSTLGQGVRAADIVEEALRRWEAPRAADGEAYVDLDLSEMACFRALFAVTDEHDGGRTPAMLTCAGLTLADAGNLPAARIAADRALAAAQATDEPSRAHALATVTRAMTAAADRQRATVLLRDALTLAGRTSRQALLHALRLGAPAITATDTSELLEQTGHAVLETASWWPLAPAARPPGDDSGFWHAAVSVARDDEAE
jgi:hypothetical protein